MQLARKFRGLIIGKDQYINSRAEFKRVLLTGYLSLLCIVSNWAYMLIGVHDEYSMQIWLNISFCVAAIFSLTFIRLKRYTVAKLILFLAAYTIVFVFCSIEPFHTGVWVYLLVINIGAIALFGYEQWQYSVTLTLVSVVLFVIAYIVEFKVLNEEYSAEFIFQNFVLNFSVSLLTVILILYFMLDLARYSEKTLEHKEAEALEKNKELTKLNSELDRFVYSVSHDLRSPLATISGLVNIGKHTESVEEAKRYFGMIDDRIKTQDYFIREIIDFYRNSRTDVNHEGFLLKDEVRQVIGEFSFGENPVSIQYQLDIPGDLQIHSDKIRLRSVLSNLIGNAVKYHDPNKADKFVRISAVQKESLTEISVEDNGSGIGEEHLPKLFDMFYRASADSKGSGLGLFIAKETVAKLGGGIQVTSSLGKGSKFIFTVTS
jgi:signal transduction histidine kinase